MSGSRGLRQQLEAGFVCAPLVYDGLSALLAQRAGFGACAVSSTATAEQLGLTPEETSLSEVIDTVRYVATAVHIPVIAVLDAVASSGNLTRAVSELEAAGAAGVLLAGTALMSASASGPAAGRPAPGDVAMNQVRAAVEVRGDADIVIIASVDASAVTGQELLERADALRAAGADLVAIEGIESLDELERCAAELAARVPVLYSGPLAPPGRLRQLGVAVHVAATGLELSVAAVRDAMARARANAIAEPVRNNLRFNELTSLLGLDEVYDLEARYATGVAGER